MSEIRVRFAPSPTGYVHVGSLRTALYNYLFARHHKGKLVLRIEDTDQSRLVEGAVENLLSTLKWANLDFDEGPSKDDDGEPYYQSQRLDIYQKYIKQLLDSGNAYPCFCSEERLTKVRDKQKDENQSIMYDGHCRGLSPSEVTLRMEKEVYVIRLNVPKEGSTIINDIIRGEVEFQNNLIDDQVLIKGDGFPTYHFANVVDDYLMGISHVIRGEEWLPSAPKHVLLYQAFGWPHPEFAHLPLLLNPDRSKLSKRQGDVAVEDYREKGILPEALINFVALLGWNRGDDQELFSLQELINDFSLERVNKAGAVFNTEKLIWMNGQYIRNLDESQYLEKGMEWLKKAGYSAREQDKDNQILLAIRDRLNTFAEIPEKTYIFFNDDVQYDFDAGEYINNDDSRAVFNVMLEEMADFPELTLENFKQMMQRVQQTTQIKGKNLWMPVRVALTGETAGPELPTVIEIFGKCKVIKLLQQAIKFEENK